METEEFRMLMHESINAVLDQRNRVDADKHAADHAFIELLRQKEQRKQEIWISVKKNVIAFLIVSTLGALSALIWSGWQVTNTKPPESHVK